MPVSIDRDLDRPLRRFGFDLAIPGGRQDFLRFRLRSNYLRLLRVRLWREYSNTTLLGDVLFDEVIRMVHSQSFFEGQYDAEKDQRRDTSNITGYHGNQCGNYKKCKVNFR